MDYKKQFIEMLKNDVEMINDEYTEQLLNDIKNIDLSDESEICPIIEHIAHYEYKEDFMVGDSIIDLMEVYDTFNNNYETIDLKDLCNYEFHNGEYRGMMINDIKSREVLLSAYLDKFDELEVTIKDGKLTFKPMQVKFLLLEFGLNEFDYYYGNPVGLINALCNQINLCDYTTYMDIKFDYEERGIIAVEGV
ncbi:MAG: hypothetical protein IKG40_01205, partial [Bacilli bacterium]|nr:hypothetical protein [Bacilli bacterium]